MSRCVLQFKVLSICPCSIKYRMIFLPGAPKISETKEDRRKFVKFFNPVFLGCNIADDTFAVAVQVTEILGIVLMYKYIDTKICVRNKVIRYKQENLSPV